MYNTNYDCNSFGCDEERICRCGEIQDAEITNINITKIVDVIYEDIFGPVDKASIRDSKLSYLLEGFGKEMDLYTIDRILRKYKVYDTSNWEIETVSGYYGQEIGDVTIKTDLAKKLEEKIFEALKKTNKQIFVLDPNNLCVGEYPSNIIFKKVGEPSNV